LDAKEKCYKVMDFFGTTGNPNKDNKIYGIHLFKKRFGGEYIEFVGEFDLVTNKFMYFIFTKLIPLYRNIKKKIFKHKQESTY
jgi:peptidoglycan pentaglycine glycine transferase (the first glycine)